MRRLFTSLMLLLLGASEPSLVRAADAAAEPPPVARILLANGDFAVGQLADCDQPNQLGWRVEGLTDNLSFPVAAVSSVHFPKPKEDDGARGPFSFELVGGDALTGSLVSLSDTDIELKSEQLGTLRIGRDQVRRIVRVQQQGDAIYIGPNGLSGWTPSTPKRPWKDEGGQLAAAAPGEISYTGCNIPAQASVEIEASWQRKAAFAIHIGAENPTLPQMLDGFANFFGQRAQVDPTTVNTTSSLFSLETWGDWIVLVRETKKQADVAPLVRIAPGPGRMHLRLLFDQTTGRVAAYSADGELLGEATALEDRKGDRGGFRLQNKSGDVRIEHLAVYSWFGDKSTAVDAERSHLETSQGAVHYSDSLTFDEATQEFVVTPDNQGAHANTQDAGPTDEGAEPVPRPSPIQVPLDDVTTLTFQPAGVATPQPVRIALYDGSRVSGELTGVSDGRLLLRRPGIDATLQAPLNQLRMIASLTSKMPLVAATNRAGRLEGAGLRLRGWLEDSNSEEPADPARSCLHWRSLTSLTSSRLAADFSGRVVYRDPPQPAKKLSAAEKRRRDAARQRQPRPLVPAQPAGLAAILQAAGLGELEVKPALGSKGPRGETQLLWLRAGDRLPCTIESIDDRGVTFKSAIVAATFLPHDAVKAWERQGGRPPSDLDPEKRKRLLTLPRMHRANPPTHLVESMRGDYLRGQLEELNEKTLRMSIRLESKSVAVNEIASIVWLEPLPSAKDEEKPADTAVADATTPDASSGRPTEATGNMQTVRDDGVRLTFHPVTVSDGVISGESDLLGRCHVDVRDIDQLLLGKAIDEAVKDLKYHQWRLKPSANPTFVTEGGASSANLGSDDPLTAKPAPEFRLALFSGGEFSLSKERGNVVVLDFWASWCGPCMQSLPKLAELANKFDPDAVRFVGVNMQEDRETVANAVERLNVKLEIALDVDGATGEKYAVSAIPHTVVIDRQGNVAAIVTGAGPDSVQQVDDAVMKALDDGTPAKP